MTTEYRTGPLPECSCSGGAHHGCDVAALLERLEQEGWTVHLSAAPSWNDGQRRSVIARRGGAP